MLETVRRLKDLPFNGPAPVKGTRKGLGIAHIIGVAGWALLGLLMIMPLAWDSRYMIYLGTLLAIWGSLAVSLNLIIGYAGQFSMSHAAFYGLGAYTTAILIGDYGFSFWGSLPIALGITAIFAVFIGYPALRFTGGIHFALVTFAFGELLRLVAANWHEVTNGPQGMLLSYSPEPVFGLSFGAGTGMYILALALLLFTLAVVAVTRVSRFGRNLLAVREDEVLAASMGIQVTATKTIAYVISSVLAALAGAIYAPFLRFISPEMMNAHETVSMIGMLIVGGIGTMGGPIVGMLIFLGLPEMLRVAQNFRLVILGFVIVFVVLFMPSGIIGLVQRTIKSRFGRRRVGGN